MLMRQVARILTALAFFTLAFLPGTAHAAVCKGKDLLKQLEIDNPKAFASIMGQAGRTVNGNALLWKIEKDKDKPASYLFGTMHVTDDRLLDVPDEVLNALNGAEIVALENLDVLDRSVTKQRLKEIPELWKFEDGKSLRDYMTEQDLETLRTAAKSFKVGFFKMLKYKPWLVMSMISTSRCEVLRKKTGKQFLDKAIGARAQRINAELVGLESLREQLSAMNSMPMKSQVAYLVGAAQLAHKSDDNLETMIQLYLKRKIGAIQPMASYYSSKTKTLKTAYSDFQTHLIDKRNIIMRDRSLPLFEKGSSFVAVGALHLPGEMGLVNLYREAGYTVTAVW